MLDMFLYLQFETFYVTSLFFQDKLAMFVNTCLSILIMSDIIQKCMPSIQAGGTTFSHVTFAAEPLVLKRSYLFTFFSHKRLLHDECLMLHVRLVARTYASLKRKEIFYWKCRIIQSINKDQCKDVCNTLFCTCLLYKHCCQIII